MEEKTETQEKIFPREIEEEMKQSYIDYSMSVIISRALPDVRDGLKPVHRRILFSMYGLGLFHNKQYRKSARIVGDCLGKYHPHGDTAVYDSLVRMAQPFSLRYPLVKGQGNFGSIDGDSAAAMRYCVTGDSLIVTENGLVPINKVSNSEDIDIKILSKDKKVNKATKWFDSGNHPTLKITTNKGYSLTGTYNHPVLTLQQDTDGRPLFIWKLMEKITPEDYVIMDRGSDDFWPKAELELKKYYPESGSRFKRRVLPSVLNEELSFILGAFLSEGSLRENRIEFCNTDYEWIKKVEDSWKTLFPDSKLHKFKRSPSSYGKKEYWRLECHCNYTLEFLRNIGLKAKKSAERKLPATIFNSPKNVVQSFLRSYFEGDGSISFAPKMIELSCCSASESLMKEIQILLLRFGIDATRRFDRYRGAHKLYLRGYLNILRFYKDIGFLGRNKQKKLEYVVYSYKKPASLRDFVPFLSDYVRSRTNNEFVNKNNFDRYGSMKKNYQKVCSILKQKESADFSGIFEYLLTYNYLFEQVAKVEEAGIQQVYSLRVDSKCHSFISNGFISHNTESRMRKIAEDMLRDLEKKTVRFTPNFDGSEEEPTVLPAKVPNLLINGTSGIAVGMATNIPPHNINEVCDGVIAFIDNPEINVEELMAYVKGPDFPTGAMMFSGGIDTAYRYGRGKVRVRAKTEIEEKEKKQAMIIKEIPYMVNKAMMVEEIVDLIREKRVIGISDIRDESDREGIRVVLELKSGVNSEVVLNQLYKHSRMQTTFGIIMLALVDNQPKVLNLKQMIEYFVKHRQEVVRKRTEFDLKKAEDRAHILEGLLAALKNIDEIIKKIKASKTVSDAEKTLMHDYNLTKIQALAILEMKLQKLASLEQEKIRKEHEELVNLIEKLKEILADEKKILAIIRKEQEEVKKEYGDERRTQIVQGGDIDIDLQDLIKKEDMVVTVSHAGYIKRLPISTYKEQRRGGKGVKAAGTRDEDFLEDLFAANTHNTLLFFTNKGKVHWLKVYMIPEGSRLARGSSIANLLNLGKDEKVTTYITVQEFKQGYLFMGTKKGVVKKVELEEFSRPRKGGILAVNLKEDDELINVLLTDGHKQIIIATKRGMANKFKEEQVRAMGRTASGVKGINLQNDEVIGMVLGDDDQTLFTITENGYGKRTNISDYRLTNRGSRGVKNIICSERNGKVVDVKQVSGQEDLMFISQKGIAIRTASAGLSVIGRNTQGVRLMKLGEEDKVVGAAKIVKEEQEEEIEKKEEEIVEKKQEEIEKMDDEIGEEIQKQEDDKKGFFGRLFGG